MGQQFRARFKIKLGVDGESRDQEYRDVLVNYDRLRETKLKPSNTFQFKKISYLYDKTAIKDYDARGRPILRYYLGILNPIVEHPDKEPTIKYKDEKGIEQETTVSGYLTNQVFDRGEVKAVIASAQKDVQKFDFMTLIIGAIMGAPLGIIIGLVLAQHGL
jgi:hypothetical protein